MIFGLVLHDLSSLNDSVLLITEVLCFVCPFIYSFPEHKHPTSVELSEFWLNGCVCVDSVCGTHGCVSVLGSSQCSSHCSGLWILCFPQDVPCQPSPHMCQQELGAVICNPALPVSMGSSLRCELPHSSRNKAGRSSPEAHPSPCSGWGMSGGCGLLVPLCSVQIQAELCSLLVKSFEFWVYFILARGGKNRIR